MNTPNPEPFVPEWPEPAPRFLRDELPPPPVLPLHQVFGPLWADWLSCAAAAKGAPPDYVLAGLLAVAGSAIGNARWAAPGPGWAEPPVIWTMAIGAPSSNKSPGLDAVLLPLKDAEREMRKRCEAELSEWQEKAEVAKLAESTWKEAAKAALKEGAEPPSKPDAANPGPEPFLPRLCIADGTIERLAVILSKQPRGTLLARDELAGWLQGMVRYSGGGSDRPFWLEAYGGRGYTVERMGRAPVQCDWLAISVTGGIQPDRLKSLLLKSDDDGLLARFLPIWPNPAPIRMPEKEMDNAFMERAVQRLLSLNMVPREDGTFRPWMVPFSEDARALVTDFRRAVREWEGEAEGLLLSFIGKLPGMAVRLSLVLSYLDWAAGDGVEPHEIGKPHLGRAGHFLEAYALPMARRAYAETSHSPPERAARRLVATIREKQWHRFTSREVQKLGRAGLGSAAEINPALAVLDEADVIHKIDLQSTSSGGRPSRIYTVNPAILRRQT